MVIQEQHVNFSQLEQSLDILIPERLRHATTDPSKLKSTTFDFWLGKFDERYRPSLIALFVEEGGLNNSPFEETNDRWETVLRTHHRWAVQQGKVSTNDQPLLSFVAQERPNKGVLILTYLDMPRLRRKGIGGEFFANLNQILKAMGYEYTIGEVNNQNLKTFLRMGGYTFRQIKEDVYPANPLTLPPSYNPDLSLIQFLDEEMEKEFVKPECIRT